MLAREMSRWEIGRLGHRVSRPRGSAWMVRWERRPCQQHCRPLSSREPRGHILISRAAPCVLSCGHAPHMRPPPPPSTHAAPLSLLYHSLAMTAGLCTLLSSWPPALISLYLSPTCCSRKEAPADRSGVCWRCASGGTGSALQDHLVKRQPKPGAGGTPTRTDLLSILTPRVIRTATCGTGGKPLLGTPPSPHVVPGSPAAHSALLIQLPAQEPGRRQRTAQTLSCETHQSSWLLSSVQPHLWQASGK